jgi:hypothetical protein
MLRNKFQMSEKDVWKQQLTKLFRDAESLGIYATFVDFMNEAYAYYK